MQLGRAIQTFALYDILSENPVCCIAQCFAKFCLSLHIFKFITSKVIPAVVVVVLGVDRQSGLKTAGLGCGRRFRSESNDPVLLTLLTLIVPRTILVSTSANSQGGPSKTWIRGCYLVNARCEAHYHVHLPACSWIRSSRVQSIAPRTLAISRFSR